jgi:lipopolysaccharide/colanic/teichoic acid biosynthesis glycosyltransferase
MAAVESAVQRSYWRQKRVVDTMIAAALITLMAPLFLLLGLVVALDVGFPTVFWQQRPGLRGRHFKLYKFRTMRSAHDRNGARVPDAQRLSAIGRFLRRTHLDELPQLYNILIGEMSIVGPRPLLPIDRASEYAARLLVQPGLTGWAQVNGACDIPARDKAALDIWYLRNASLRLDLIVMARTILTIVRGERTHAEAVRKARDELANSPAFALRHVGPRAANAEHERPLAEATTQTAQAKSIGLRMVKAGT